MDSNSEQAVVDALVDAVHIGDGDRKVECANGLLDGYAERAWRRRRIVESGGILLHSELTRESVTLEDLEGLLPDDRIDQIASGSRLSDEEFEIWRAKVITNGLEVTHQGDGNACVILQLRHSDGRLAHLAAMRWRGGSGELVAVYPTYTEALNALKEVGLVIMDSQLTFEDLIDL